MTKADGDFNRLLLNSLSIYFTSCYFQPNYASFSPNSHLLNGEVPAITFP